MGTWPMLAMGNYEFQIGHISLPPITAHAEVFNKPFSINQNGDLTVTGKITAHSLDLTGGAKVGFVCDYFINQVGDALEQGDVVVIGGNPSTRYYAENNVIPISEVDLTDRSYDTRVCGIVSEVVTTDALPYAEMEETPSSTENSVGSRAHPLKDLSVESSEDLDRTKIEDKHLGKMVITGAYAHCKVIAPIKVGDLLTTSSTKGHAQRVEDPTKAIGAIIGKALGSLKRGKGKIPVLVTLK